MIDLARVPLLVAIAAEVASWALLAVRLVFTVPGRLRWRALAGVVIGVVLLQVIGTLQRTPPRTLALMAVIVSLSLSLTTIVARSDWEKSFQAQERYGDGSPEARKLGRKLGFIIIGIMLVLGVLFLLIFKGAGI